MRLPLSLLRRLAMRYALSLGAAASLKGLVAIAGVSGLFRFPKPSLLAQPELVNQAAIHLGILRLQVIQQLAAP